MKTVRAVCFALGCTLLVSGCVPRFNTVEPGVKGTVIDAETRRPIAGALLSGGYRSDAEGRFEIPPRSELGIATVMGGRYPIYRTYSVGKTGYLPRLLYCMTISVSGACCDPVEIALEPADTAKTIDDATLEKMLAEPEYAVDPSMKRETIALPSE